MKITRCLISALIACALVLGAAGGALAGALNPASPVIVTVWNYYNGDQLAAFDNLVDEFNRTVGLDKGVVVVNVSQGNIDTLADSLLASVNKEAGAQDAPTLAAVYSETAFILDRMGVLAPLDGYFTDSELAAFVPGFIEEGRFGAHNELMLFPILKSTELFSANQTDWAAFADATGITLESIATIEDLTSAAEAYYEWTDSLTPDVREDGKALYGRDSVANYVFIGCYQLGEELVKVNEGDFTINLNRDVFRTLWDNYYIPFINGYFGAYARFRSEDCKTGRILALTSSSSSSSYLPTAVTQYDDTTYPIDTYIRSSMPFKNAVNDAVVQQGASYCVLKGTDAEQEGAVEFLKWFTESERNMRFALMSGYLPVKLEANTREAIQSAYSGDTLSPKGVNVLNSLFISADAFAHNEAYAIKPFDGSKVMRAIIGDALESVATADRASVKAAIDAGASRAEAVAPYITDEYFGAWFDDLVAQVTEAAN